MSNYRHYINLNNLGRAKLYIDKSMYEKLFDTNHNRYPQNIINNHRLTNHNDLNVEINFHYDEGEFALNELNEIINQCNYIVESKLNVDNQVIKFTSSIFEDILKKYFEKIDIIPYDFNDRKELLKDEFKDLDYYIKKYISKK